MDDLTVARVARLTKLTDKELDARYSDLEHQAQGQPYNMGIAAEMLGCLQEYRRRHPEIEK